MLAGADHATVAVPLAREEWGNLVLHSALHDFERRLLAATGGFKYLNGAIACTHVDA